MTGMTRKILIGGVVMTLGALAACAPKPAPAPPPPPRPVATYAPARPMPPLGAAPNLTVPPLNALGQRQTINTGISSAQTTWNLRSAYNVAALNCLRPEHTEILVGYKAFLKAHARGLTAANSGVDSEFRSLHGSGFVRQRETYMTQVYNYFAYPPTVGQFCDVALQMARESQAVKPADLSSFSATQLQRFELMFDTFFRSYEQYRTDAALWDARYAPAVMPAAVPATTTR